jgi:hypothetical protein
VDDLRHRHNYVRSLYLGRWPISQMFVSLAVWLTFYLSFNTCCYLFFPFFVDNEFVAFRVVGDGKRLKLRMKGNLCKRVEGSWKKHEIKF